MNNIILILILVLIFFYFFGKNENFLLFNKNIKQKNIITSKIDNTGINIFGKSSIKDKDNTIIYTSRMIDNDNKANKNFEISLTKKVNYPPLNIKSINSSTTNIKNLFPQSVKKSTSITQSNIIT
jgi:hypothetical protein